MADGATMRLTGLDDAIRKLDRLPDRIARKAVLAGLRKGAAEFKRYLKSAAPARSGGGPKRIGSRSTRTRAPGFLRRKGIITRKQRGRGAYQVGPMGAAYYAQFSEQGTRHQQRRPWIAPSWQAQRRRVLFVVTQAMEAAVRREARKVARGG